MSNFPEAFCIPNHVSSSVFRVHPWSFSPTISRPDKATTERLLKRPDTKHCIYSFVEGKEPGLRVNKDNEGYMIHALVADYDAKVDPSLKNTIGDRAGEYMPTFFSKTLGGNGRAIYIFEEPVLIPSLAFGKLLMRVLKTKLKLTKVLPGLDEPALEDLSKYYELGLDWEQLSSDVLSSAFLKQAMFEAGNRFDWKKVADIEIPLPDCAKEIERKWPGRWTGTFEEGARSVVPFNPQSTNPTSCIVRKTGLQVFSDIKPFYSWRDLFGRKFVEAYSASMLGSAIEGVYFDGKDYWSKNDAGIWISLGVSDVTRMLRIKGLSSVPGKSETASDVDLAIHRIQQHQSVKSAAPWVHRPQGLIRDSEGDLVLNTSITRLVKPRADHVSDVAKEAPFIIDFLAGFFNPIEQLDYFLHWFQRWYLSALAQRMVAGQAVFIAGPVGVGKTFLSNVICSIAMGGHRDASKFLIGETSFNEHLFSHALWTVDDSLPVSKGYSKKLEFSANVKASVANQDMEVQAKFRRTAQVVWNGRIMTTCNDDPESLRILPDLDINIRDKVLFFRAAQRTFPFLQAHENREKVAAEMPTFLRWLQDWTPPAHVVSQETRFGTEPYQEGYMLEEAMSSSMADNFREVLELFMEHYCQTGVRVFLGSATEMLGAMELVDEIPRSVLRGYTAVGIGRRLTQLEAMGYPVSRKRTKGGRGFQIDMDEIEAHNKKIGKTD